MVEQFIGVDLGWRKIVVCQHSKGKRKPRIYMCHISDSIYLDELVVKCAHRFWVEVFATIEDVPSFLIYEEPLCPKISGTISFRNVNMILASMYIAIPRHVGYRSMTPRALVSMLNSSRKELRAKYRKTVERLPATVYKFTTESSLDIKCTTMTSRSNRQEVQRYVQKFINDVVDAYIAHLCAKQFSVNNSNGG